MTPAPRYSQAADSDDSENTPAICGNEIQRHSAALAWLDDVQAAEAGAEVEPAVGGKEE